MIRQKFTNEMEEIIDDWMIRHKCNRGDAVEKITESIAENEMILRCPDCGNADLDSFELGFMGYREEDGKMYGFTAQGDPDNVTEYWDPKEDNPEIENPEPYIECIDVTCNECANNFYEDHITIYLAKKRGYEQYLPKEE